MTWHVPAAHAAAFNSYMTMAQGMASAQGVSQGPMASAMAQGQPTAQEMPGPVKMKTSPTRIKGKIPHSLVTTMLK